MTSQKADFAKFLADFRLLPTIAALKQHQSGLPVRGVAKDGDTRGGECVVSPCMCDAPFMKSTKKKKFSAKNQWVFGSKVSEDQKKKKKEKVFAKKSVGFRFKSK